jgi:Domain of unknown function (DUF1918)
MQAKAGDRIVVESESVGTPPREGDILDVRTSETGTSYRVRWSDGHESLFRPSVGSARVIQQRGRRKSKS